MNVGTALIIAAIGTLIIWVAYHISGFKSPLLMGVITGIIIGNPQLGLQVGAACSMMSIGFHTFGGATVPNYNMGAIFGVIFVSQGNSIEEGIIVGSVVALLGSWADIIQGLWANLYIHRADKALEQNNSKKMEFWHLAGFFTIAVTDFVPTFLGLLVIDKVQVITDFVNSAAWAEAGLNLVGGILPAVGFALLISYMNLKENWWALLLGYVLYSYGGFGTMALALVGLIVAYVYETKLDKEEK